MLDIILIITIIFGWIAVIIWAYWNNGGIEDFKKSFKKVLDKNYKA